MLSLCSSALKAEKLTLEDLLLKGKRAEASKIHGEKMEIQHPLSIGLQKLEISEAKQLKFL